MKPKGVPKYTKIKTNYDKIKFKLNTKHENQIQEHKMCKT
jgi:hypothetical protein